VVLFTSHTDEALVERARRPASWPNLLKPLRPAELAPALDLAIARFAETRQLKQTLEDRKVIERPKGMLMARFGLTEDDAFKRLRRAAMDSRKPMVEVAPRVARLGVRDLVILHRTTASTIGGRGAAHITEPSTGDAMSTYSRREFLKTASRGRRRRCRRPRLPSIISAQGKDPIKIGVLHFAVGHDGPSAKCRSATSC